MSKHSGSTVGGIAGNGSMVWVCRREEDVRDNRYLYDFVVDRGVKVTVLIAVSSNTALHWESWHLQSV